LPSFSKEGGAWRTQIGPARQRKPRVTGVFSPHSHQTPTKHPALRGHPLYERGQGGSYFYFCLVLFFMCFGNALLFLPGTFGGDFVNFLVGPGGVNNYIHSGLRADQFIDNAATQFFELDFQQAS